MVPFSVKCDYVQGFCVVTGRTIRCKMPSDMVSIVSTGLGVSVLAGILSGVCYVLAHGIIKKGRSKKQKSEWYCEICGTYLHSTSDILNDDLTTCSKCGANVCSGKCSKFVQQTRWVCQNCLKPSESWFKGILKAIQPSSSGISGTFGPIMNPQTNSNPDLESLRKLEKEQVRDFIEKLVNVMLGENVDNASVSMLYNDKQYLPIVGQSPCTAHAALKQIIEKLLKEAVNLPLLEKAHAHPITSSVEDTTNSSYEDLLATAIINKVISSCQNNLPSSSANSVSSRVSTSSRNKDDKEYFFGEETLDTKWKTTDLDTTSVSSLEDWMQSESSFGSRKYVDKVTLMIKQDIEEVDNFDSDEEEDDAEYFRSSSSLFNDSESNWFLQKRQFQGTQSPVPVPMLVPNPTTEAKVLIGDKPLDDTSDLSDVGSDYEDPEPPQATHSLLVQSKNIIGGGKSNFEIVENGDEQSESSTDSGVKEVNGNEQKSFDIPDSIKTDITVDDDNVEDSSFFSVYSNTEKEAEYTERYASLPRQILKTSTPNRSSKEAKSKNVNDKPEENNERHENNSDFEYVGSYSKKEKEKWKHAIEMENNPYSKENIEKRIKTNSASSPLFGPDYYAKLAKKPSGGAKLLSNEINGVSWPPQETQRSRTPSPVPELPKVQPPPIEFDNTTSSHSLEVFDLAPTPIHFVESRSPPELPKKGPPSKGSFEIDGIHQAIQAIVTPVHENMPDSSLESQVDIITPEKKPQLYKRGNYIIQTNTSELTSDSDLSFVNFYDVEHSQIFRKTKNEDIHIPITATPLGVSYRSIADENGNNEAINYNQETVIPHAEEKINPVLKKAPVAKPRVLGVQTKTENGLYIKAASAEKHRHLSSTSPTERPALRRNLSESSLLEQSSDNSPKILHHKKDNTLISKIYKDPKVRLFALHSREEVPGTDSEYNMKFALHSQLSYDSKVTLNENSSLYLTKGRSYNSSEDGLTSEYESGKTGKMSFFSSEEDLLSINSEEGSRNGNVISTKNEDVKIKNEIDKSEEVFRTHSPNYAITPRSANLNNKFIYGSQENLLSVEEVGALPQRKDNTLISKIYKDANVRNFALKTHRGIIPDYEPPILTKQKTKKPSMSDEEQYDNAVTVQKRTMIHKKMYNSYDDLSSADISLEGNVHYTIEHQKNSSNYLDQHVNEEDGYKSEDLDVEEVAKRHVVRDALGKFSKSEIKEKSPFERSMSLEESDGIRVSVRDLKKKFESNDTGTKPVISSLTARSLSKQVKDSLKQ